MFHRESPHSFRYNLCHVVEKFGRGRVVGGRDGKEGELGLGVPRGSKSLHTTSQGDCRVMKAKATPAAARAAVYQCQAKNGGNEKDICCI